MINKYTIFCFIALIMLASCGNITTNKDPAVEKKTYPKPSTY